MSPYRVRNSDFALDLNLVMAAYIHPQHVTSVFVLTEWSSELCMQLQQMAPRTSKGQVQTKKFRETGEEEDLAP